MNNNNGINIGSERLNSIKKGDKYVSKDCGDKSAIILEVSKNTKGIICMVEVGIIFKGSIENKSMRIEDFQNKFMPDRRKPADGIKKVLTVTSKKIHNCIID